MLLPSFFSLENLTGWLSLSTLIKALRTVMELSREKHGRSISLSYMKGVLIASAVWAPGVPCSVGATSFLSSLQRAVPGSYGLRVDLWMFKSAVGSTEMGTDS